MSLDVTELLADLPAVINIVQKLKAGAAELPPAASRKATDYVALLNSVDMDLAALLDQVLDQAKS